MSEQPIGQVVAALREAEAKATQGEWKCAGDDLDDEENDPYIYIDLPAGGHKAVSILFNADWAKTEDGEFVSLAKKHITRLCDEVERLQKELTAMTADRNLIGGKWVCEHDASSEAAYYREYGKPYRNARHNAAGEKK